MPEGYCNCKSIRVTVPSPLEKSALCYCANCSRAGSSSFSIVHFLPKSEVDVKDPQGFLKSYVDSNTKSGNSITRQFCGNCGSPVATLLSPDSEMIIVKGGLFDQVPPVADEFFTDCKPDWLQVVKKD